MGFYLFSTQHHHNRRGVISFDPVVDEVLGLISKQLAVLPNIDALLLVGGFSGSAYLKKRIEVRCISNVLCFQPVSRARNFEPPI